jgi:hypothetical protein
VNTTPLFLIIDSSREAREKAVESFEAQPQAVSSQTVSSWPLPTNTAREIFGFDKQFEDAGYNRLEPSTDWKEAS